MLIALLAVTVAEIVVFVAVLAIYLALVDRQLRVISSYLGKIAFGVRAVDTQTSTIGPSVLRVNATLRDIDAALGPIAEKAKQKANAQR